MKQSKFSEEQVTYALRQHEAGTPAADICRQLGVSEATFYVWKKKYAHLGVAELRELRQLREENSRLKRVHRLYRLEGLQLRMRVRRRKHTCLNVNQFLSLDHAKQTIKAWQEDYNHHRPHGSLGNLTPMEYRVRHGYERTSTASKFQL